MNIIQIKYAVEVYSIDIINLFVIYKNDNYKNRFDVMPKNKRFLLKEIENEYLI